MSETVLVLNAGSSSLKYAALDGERAAASGTIDRVSDFAAAMRQAVDELRGHGVDAAAVAAVGHRVVHGGPDLTEPVVVDDAVLATIDELAVLAPLHNPNAAACIRAAREAAPDVPQVACFDTAFFADLPAAAATYAVDRDLARAERIRRYGFHGISHEYVAGEAAAVLGRDPGALDQVVLHLGNGASASAISGGRPVATSMGMTPLAGLVMGTRSGDLDPGVVVHLLRHAGLDADEVDDLLQHRSGLLGLSGHSDFRDLCRAVDAGDRHARLAYDVYVHRLRCYVGAYLAVLGGADAIVFTGGVGENSADVRADSLTGLARLGIAVDPVRNGSGADGRVISPDESAVAVLVVPTDEELAIARATRGLLG
jgi:acetate kinase